MQYQMQVLLYYSYSGGVKLENKEPLRNYLCYRFAVLFSRVCPGSYCRNSLDILSHIPFIPHPLPSMLVASPLLLAQASSHFGFHHNQVPCLTDYQSLLQVVADNFELDTLPTTYWSNELWSGTRSAVSHSWKS